MRRLFGQGVKRFIYKRLQQEMEPHMFQCSTLASPKHSPSALPKLVIAGMKNGDQDEKKDSPLFAYVALISTLLHCLIYDIIFTTACSYS